MSDAAPAVVMPQTEPAADTEAADTEASAAAEAGGVPTGIEAGAGADEWAQTVADGLARKPGDGTCCVLGVLPEQRLDAAAVQLLAEPCCRARCLCSGALMRQRRARTRVLSAARCKLGGDGADADDADAGGGGAGAEAEAEAEAGALEDTRGEGGAGLGRSPADAAARLKAMIDGSNARTAAAASARTTPPALKINDVASMICLKAKEKHYEATYEVALVVVRACLAGAPDAPAGLGNADPLPSAAGRRRCCRGVRRRRQGLCHPARRGSSPGSPEGGRGRHLCACNDCEAVRAATLWPRLCELVCRHAWLRCRATGTTKSADSAPTRPCWRNL